MPLWYKRDLSLGATGPDVRVVRRKFGMVDGPYDRTVSELIRGLASGHSVPYDGTLTSEIAELLGPAADEAEPPTWWHWTTDAVVLAHELPEQLGYLDEDAVRRLQSSLSLDCTGTVDLDLAKAMGSL